MKISFRTLSLAAMLSACPWVSYAQQNDPDGDGVLNPTASAPAFGVYVDYKQFPQLTDVPTIYLTSDQPFEITKDMAKTEEYYTATIVIVDRNGKMKQRNEAVTFRGRGNSTWKTSTKKKPWRLKFPSKTSLLSEWDMATGTEVKNYADAKSWTLLCNVFDKTLMRNALSAELGKRAGLTFNPAYRFVDLVLNGHYMGTYQVSDHIQVDKKRVAVNSKTGWFTEFSKDGMKEDPYFYAKAQWNNVATSIKNPETDIITANGETSDPQYDAMKAWYSQYLTALNSGNYDTWRSQTDFTSLIGWMMVEDLSGNYDGAMANVYTYKEAEDKKLKWGPLWDLDLAYGSYRSLSGQHFWQAQSEGVGYLIAKMFDDPYFVKAYYETWQTFRDGDGLKKFANSIIDQLSATLAQTQARNYNTTNDSFRQWDPAWDITSSVDWSGNGVASYAVAVQNLRSYFDSRISWLESEYATMYKNLGCKDLKPIDDDEDDPDDPDDDTPSEDKGLEPFSDAQWESWGGRLYTYTGSARTLKEGTKIEIVTTKDNTDLYYGAAHNEMWKDGPGTKISSFSLTATDAAKLAQNGYKFLIVVWDRGECTSVTVTPPDDGSSKPDLPTMVRIILGKAPASSYKLSDYNLNGDKVVSVADLVLLIKNQSMK